MKKPLLFSLFLFGSASLQAQVRAYDFFIQVEKGDTLIMISSAQTFPCLGYGIRTHQLWSGDTLMVDLLGFLKPEPCYSDSDPARQKIRMVGILTDTFYIKFRWEENKGKRFEDKWKVEIKREMFKVTPLISTFSRYTK